MAAGEQGSETLRVGPENGRIRAEQGLVISMLKMGDEVAVFLDDVERTGQAGRWGCTTRWQGSYFYTSFTLPLDRLDASDLSDEDYARIGRAVVMRFDPEALAESPPTGC